MNANKTISIVTSILVFFLASAAFALSYDSLLRVALAAGVNPRLAFLWPLGLDATMLVSGLVALVYSLQGQSAKLARVLVFAFTALSIAFNVSHILAFIPAWVVFVIPPFTVFISWELLTTQARDSIKRASAIKSLREIENAIERAQADLAQLQAQADGVETQTKRKRRQSSGDNQDANLRLESASQSVAQGWSDDSLLQYLLANPDTTQAQAARYFGKPQSTVKRAIDDRLALRGLRRNGNGWELAQN